MKRCPHCGGSGEDPENRSAVALLFKPIKGTPRPADIGKTVLFRHPPRSDGFVRYQASAYQQWMHAPDSYPVEWAELP